MKYKMDTVENKKPSLLGNLTVQILIAMILGAVLGIAIHNNYLPEEAKSFSDKIKMLATIFIRLVQMIIRLWFYYTCSGNCKIRRY